MSNPAEFDALPLAEQQRIQNLARTFAELALSYSTYVFIAGAQDAELDINLGSAFIVSGVEAHVLVTAEHVLAKYESRKESEASVSFQAGECILDLTGRKVFRDKTLDVACLRISDRELSRIGCVPFVANHSWPHAQISGGDYVQFCGFPAFYRRDLGRAKLSIAPFAGFVKVDAVHPTHLMCVFERDEWVVNGPEGVPPTGTVLGGLSGGPVLLRSELQHPIVGLVSEFHSSFELLRIARLPHPFPWHELA